MTAERKLTLIIVNEENQRATTMEQSTQQDGFETYFIFEEYEAIFQKKTKCITYQYP